MATISKLGIGDGNLIEAEHITRIIDALSGTGSADIIVTGSLKTYNTFNTATSLDTAAYGLFNAGGDYTVDWDGCTLYSGTPVPSVNWGSRELVNSTGNLTLDWENVRLYGTASYAATASFLTGTIDSASFSSTASFVNILKQNVTISGSTSISGSVTQTAGNATFRDDVFIGGTKHWPEQTVTTTDETKTIIWTDTISTFTGAWIDATIIGKSGSRFITGDLKAGFFRSNLAAPFKMGEITSSFNNFVTTEVSYGAESGPSAGIIRIWVSGSAECTWVAAVKIHTNT